MVLRTLHDIGREWVNFPAPEDCGFLAFAVLHARQMANTTWTTAHIPMLAQQHSWALQPDASVPNWDQSAQIRTIALLAAAGVNTHGM